MNFESARRHLENRLCDAIIFGSTAFAFTYICLPYIAISGERGCARTKELLSIYREYKRESDAIRKIMENWSDSTQPSITSNIRVLGFK